MRIQCSHCPAFMEIRDYSEDIADTSYKLLCPALRENLAAQVLRENLAGDGRSDIEPECPYMREARNAAILERQAAASQAQSNQRAID